MYHLLLRLHATQTGFFFAISVGQRAALVRDEMASDEEDDDDFSADDDEPIIAKRAVAVDEDDDFDDAAAGNKMSQLIKHTLANTTCHARGKKCRAVHAFSASLTAPAARSAGLNSKRPKLGGATPVATQLHGVSMLTAAQQSQVLAQMAAQGAAAPGEELLHQIIAICRLLKMPEPQLHQVVTTLRTHANPQAQQVEYLGRLQEAWRGQQVRENFQKEQLQAVEDARRQAQAQVAARQAELSQMAEDGVVSAAAVHLTHRRVPRRPSPPAHCSLLSTSPCVPTEQCVVCTRCV